MSWTFVNFSKVCQCLVPYRPTSGWLLGAGLIQIINLWEKNSKQEILKMNGDVPKMFDQRGVPHPGQNGKARVPSTAQPELCALKGAKIYRSTLCPDPTLLCVLCEVEAGNKGADWNGANKNNFGRINLWSRKWVLLFLRYRNASWWIFVVDLMNWQGWVWRWLSNPMHIMATLSPHARSAQG